MQKHLQVCAHAQGLASTAQDVFGSYVVSEQGDSGVFLPQRQDNEAPLGARAAETHGALLHKVLVQQRCVVACHHEVNMRFVSFAAVARRQITKCHKLRRRLGAKMKKRTKKQFPCAGSHQGSRTMLVVMLGGCTYAEMTALRTAAAQQDSKLVILTTDVMTSDRLMQSFMPDSTKLASADAAATAAVL